jgi:hypothetical protein
MTRSVKKGPFIDFKLEKKDTGDERKRKKNRPQDMVEEVDYFS